MQFPSNGIDLMHYVKAYMGSSGEDTPRRRGQRHIRGIQRTTAATRLVRLCEACSALIIGRRLRVRAGIAGLL